MRAAQGNRRSASLLSATAAIGTTRGAVRWRVRVRSSGCISADVSPRDRRRRLLLQHHHGAQAGMIVLQLQRAAVQAGPPRRPGSGRGRRRACRGWHHRDRSARSPSASRHREFRGRCRRRRLHRRDSAPRRTSTRMLPPSGVYLSALSIRLPTACASSTGSPRTGAGPLLANDSVQVLELGRRQIELDRLGGNFGHVDRHEARSGACRCRSPPGAAAH